MGIKASVKIPEYSTEPSRRIAGKYEETQMRTLNRAQIKN